MMGSASPRPYAPCHPATIPYLSTALPEHAPRLIAPTVHSMLRIRCAVRYCDSVCCYVFAMRCAVLR
eukprot:1016878-Rhodomonas_salina.1